MDTRRVSSSFVSAFSHLSPSRACALRLKDLTSDASLVAEGAELRRKIRCSSVDVGFVSAPSFALLVIELRPAFPESASTIIRYVALSCGLALCRLDTINIVVPVPGKGMVATIFGGAATMPSINSQLHSF